MEKLELVIFDMDGTLYKFKGSGKDNAIYQTDFYREVKDRGIKFLIEKFKASFSQTSIHLAQLVHLFIKTCSDDLLTINKTSFSGQISLHFIYAVHFS